MKSIYSQQLSFPIKHQAKPKNKKATIVSVSSSFQLKFQLQNINCFVKNSIPSSNFQIKFFPGHKLAYPWTIMLYIYQRDTCHALPNRTISRHRCFPAYPSPSRWGGRDDRRRRKTNETVVVPNETRNLPNATRRPSFHGRARKESVLVLQHGANTFTDHCNLLLHWSEFRDLPNRTLITLTLINKSRYGAVNNDSVVIKWHGNGLMPHFSPFFILMEYEGILLY